MTEIGSEKDLERFEQLTSERILILPEEVSIGIMSIVRDFKKVGWGSRVFKNSLGDFVIVPDADKWIQTDGLGDLQVVKFHFDTNN